MTRCDNYFYDKSLTMRLVVYIEYRKVLSSVEFSFFKSSSDCPPWKS